LISSLAISNFQTHAKLKLDNIGPITTFVGRSNSGKSAVIRAIIWLITNKPGGTAHIKHGETKCRVRVDFDTGETSVVRLREGRKNVYKLNGVELANLGADVPDTVSHAINVAPASIQQQHDAPFMLGLSPKQLATTINRLAGLDVADKFMAAARTSAREAKATAKATTAELADAEQALAAIPDFTHLKPKLAKCNDLVERIEQLDDDIVALAAMVRDIGELEEALRKKIDLAAVDAKYAKLRLLDNRRDSLDRCIEAADACLRIRRRRIDFASAEEVASRRLSAGVHCDAIALAIHYADGAEMYARKARRIHMDSAKLSASIAQHSELSRQVAAITAQGRLVKELMAITADADVAAFEAQDKFDSEFSGKGCPLCGKK
jgi:DNA repair exonuclease SbcCD ATPase subunit